MPRKFPVKKPVVTRKLTGNSDTDRALRDVYDKLDDLQPVIAKEESPLINRKAKIGDTMLVQNDTGEDMLAVFTSEGWKIDVNSKLISVDGRNFRPLSGLRSMNYRVNPGESVTYTKHTDYAVNDILRFNGKKFVASQEGLDFTFTWNSLLLNFTGGDSDSDDVTDSSPNASQSHYGVLIGNSAGTWATGVNLDCNFSNFAIDRFTSVTVTWARKSDGGTTTTAANLNPLIEDTVANGVSSDNTVTLNYPTITEGASNTSTAYYEFITTFKYKLDPTTTTETTYTATQNVYFGNKKFLGTNTSATALNEAAIEALDDKIVNTRYMTSSTLPAMGTNGVSLDGTARYIHYWYPKRLSATPTFSVGPTSTSLLPEVWTALGGSGVSVDNGRGFEELYMGYRSPEPLDNTTGVTTWYVKVDH